MNLRGSAKVQPDYVPRTKVEVVVKDEQMEEIISKVTDRLGGELGGKIFVVDVPIAVDIKTKKEERLRFKQDQVARGGHDAIRQLFRVN